MWHLQFAVIARRSRDMAQIHLHGRFQKVSLSWLIAIETLGFGNHFQRTTVAAPNIVTPLV